MEDSRAELSWAMELKWNLDCQQDRQSKGNISDRVVTNLMAS